MADITTGAQLLLLLLLFLSMSLNVRNVTCGICFGNIDKNKLVAFFDETRLSSKNTKKLPGYIRLEVNNLSNVDLLIGRFIHLGHAFLGAAFIKATNINEFKKMENMYEKIWRESQRVMRGPPLDAVFSLPDRLMIVLILHSDQPSFDTGFRGNIARSISYIDYFTDALVNFASLKNKLIN